DDTDPPCDNPAIFVRWTEDGLGSQKRSRIHRPSRTTVDLRECRPMIADDRDRIFGLLAIQNGWVAATSFGDALRDQDRAIPQALVEAGVRTVPQRDVLEALTTEHLKRHDDDTTRCLASLTAGPSTRERIARIGDPEVTATLAPSGAIRHDDVGDGLDVTA